MSTGPNKTCRLCGRTGFMGGSINGEPYCHEGGRSCYQRASYAHRVPEEDRHTYLHGTPEQRLQLSIQAMSKSLEDALAQLDDNMQKIKDATGQLDTQENTDD